MSRITNTTIDQCVPSQLKALLALAADSNVKRLSLAVQLPSRDALASLIGELCGQTAESGEAVLAAVRERTTPLAALRGVKELAKDASSKATAAPQRAAASLLYHLAVAAALGFHGKNISTHSPATRLALYDDLVIALRDDPLAEVFHAAIDRIFATNEETADPVNHAAQNSAEEDH